MAAVAPVARLKKAELIWLSNHKCKHSHSYIEHYGCYLNEMPEGSPLVHRIGFFDLEFHNLKASVGVLFGYCIKDINNDKIYESWVNSKDYKVGQLPDKRVIKDCVEDLKKFDLIVTYYGTRCDMPYIRTKAMMNGIEFPEYGVLTHLDLFFLVRSKFSLHRNSLDVACETLLGESQKTRVTPKHWMKALFGDQESLDYIADHCRKDVLMTEKLYKKVLPFRKRLDQSA